MHAALARSCRLTLSRLAGDREGAIAVIMALGLTMLLGFAGLGVDVAVWQTSKRDIQGAADQAAYSAAISVAAGESAANARTSGKGVAAKMGYVDAQGGATVTINNPPTQGTYAGN